MELVDGSKLDRVNLDRPNIKVIQGSIRTNNQDMWNVEDFREKERKLSGV